MEQHNTHNSIYAIKQSRRAGGTEPGEVDADGGAEVAFDLVERLRLEHVHRVRPLLFQMMQLALLVHAVHGDELLVDERLHHQVRDVQRAHQLLAVREFAAKHIVQRADHILVLVLVLVSS